MLKTQATARVLKNWSTTSSTSYCAHQVTWCLCLWTVGGNHSTFVTTPAQNMFTLNSNPEPSHCSTQVLAVKKNPISQDHVVSKTYQLVMNHIRKLTISHPPHTNLCGCVIVWSLNILYMLLVTSKTSVHSENSPDGLGIIRDISNRTPVLHQFRR